MNTPRIRTTLVGSYPVPQWLVQAGTEEAFRDATRVVIATQERAGLDIVCDGELYRFDPDHPETNGMIDYFTRAIGGIRTQIGMQEIMDFRKQSGMGFRRKPAGIVDAGVSSVNEGMLNLVQPCEVLQTIASKPIKFTLTGPHMLAKTLAFGKQGGDLRELAMKLAEILARQVSLLDAEIVQIDEANLPGNPGEWVWALDAINMVLDAVRTTPAIHLCFGNYGGQRIQSGKWEQLLEFFNGLRADHVVLECKRRPEDEVHALAEINPAIGLGVGVIDVKDTVIESAEEVARQLEKMEKVLGEDRIKFIHPDCGLWMLPRSVADGKIAAVVKGRDLYLGAE